MKIFSSILLVVCMIYSDLEAAGQPNPPAWPAGSVASGGVFVFTDSDPSVQNTLNQIFSITGNNPITNPSVVDNGQFIDNRYALLFQPGNYSNLTVPVGYYTSVIGLGQNPTDTSIYEVVSYQGGAEPSTGALNTFWRSAENFTMAPSNSYWSGGPICMLWAVSQACPLRRVVLTGANGNLCLFQYIPPYSEAGFASGGFMADCSVSGDIISGSQQQWLTRNTDMSSWQNGVWNMVFVGCPQAPATNCGNANNKSPYTTVTSTPVIAEKPYMTIDSMGKYYLNIPSIQQNKIGSSFDPANSSIAVLSVDFSDVYVATPADTADSINTQINSGNHIILTPGIYNLTGTINVNTDNIVILGIGFPTLVSTTGLPCIQVGSADGVRIGGILLQAGTINTNALLIWGNKGDQPTSGFLYDCFARVGVFMQNGPETQANILVQINSANIVLDNLWLWRADHDNANGQGTSIVTDSANPCNTALQVNGDDITAYGLACEHTLQDIVQWNGNKGSVYFFQSEYPYDVTEANYGQPMYVAFRLNESVTNFLGYGLGVYCFFRDNFVTVNSGISAPFGQGIQLNNSLTRYLNGNGGISNVINSIGGSVNSSNPGPQYQCSSPDASNFRTRSHRR